MSTFRLQAKPAKASAVQWRGDNEAELIAFTDGAFEAIAPEDRANTDDPEATAAVLDRHSAWVLVYTNQWIVKDDEGLRPLSNDAIKKAYDLAPDEHTAAGENFEELVRDVLRRTIWPEPHVNALIAESRRARTEVAQLRAQLSAEAAGAPLTVDGGQGEPVEKPHPDRACPHEEFAALVEVNRIRADKNMSVVGYSADIKVHCCDCGEPFRWIGVEPGASPRGPMCSIDETELRAPLRPASADPDFGLGLPGVAVRINQHQDGGSRD